ncbi:MAG TPA: HD domain-containing phosphohydrolase [Gemmatimonadaceae bacterium]|nr:HD domain-containing phosphohydrolase [Gemmatimonadaceae bacterium]
MAGIVVVVTAAMTVLAYFQVRRGLIAAASDRLSHVTHQLEDLLATSARASYASMSTVANSGAVRSHLTAPSNASADSVRAVVAKQWRPSPTVTGFEIWDMHGEVRLASPPTMRRLEATERAALISALSSSPTGFMSAYRPGGAGDTLESAAIVPIKVDSTLRGFLIQRRRLSTTPQGVKSLTELIGSNARLLIGSRDGKVWNDLIKSVPGVPSQYMMDTSVLTFARASEQRVLARTVPVATTDWLLAVEFLEEPILAPAAQFLRRAFTLGALLALIAALVGVLVSRNITKPLLELTDAASSLASGTDSARVKIARNDELGQLATSFNAMAEQIELGHMQLAGALERYRLMFDRNPVPMWVFARDTLRFLDVNTAAINHYGYSREEFLAMTLKDIRPTDEIPFLVSSISEPLQTPSRQRIWKHRKKDGSLIDVEIVRTDIELQGRAASFALANDITDRLAAEHAIADAKERIQLQFGRLKALRAIDTAILGTTDLRLLLKSVLHEIMAQLRGDAAVIFLFNPHTLTVDTSASIGYRTRAAERERVPLGDGVAGRAARERRTIAVPDLAEHEMSTGLKKVADDEGIRAVYAVPLIAKGQVIGVLDVLFRKPYKVSDDWLEFCEALAGQAAMAIESCKSFEELQRANLELSLAYDRTIEGWSRALDMRDKETEGHTQRVTEMTMRVGRLAGISEAELVHVRRGALLHDIGKMGVPDAILLKPGPLTNDEWKIMRLHPVFAVELLAAIEYLRPALDIPYCHHEKWDGSGYPRGLKADQIPLAARLFAVVDVWDALRSDRPYRQGWSDEKVRQHIREGSGTHFDPRAIELFFHSLDELPNVESLTDHLEDVPLAL